MSNVPAELKYSKSHEWIKVEGDSATIGISDHAQSALGDITYVELPEEDDEFDAGESFGSIESVKAASDLYLPVSGTVTEINENLEDAPETVNQDAYGKGWLLKIKITDNAALSGLMDATAYEAMLAEEN